MEEKNDYQKTVKEMVGSVEIAKDIEDSLNKGSGDTISRQEHYNNVKTIKNCVVFFTVLVAISLFISVIIGIKISGMLI